MGVSIESKILAFQHVPIRYHEQIRVGVGVVHQITIKKSLDRIITEIIQSVTITLNLISVLIPDGKIQIRIRIVASDQEQGSTDQNRLVQDQAVRSGLRPKNREV